jgi:hypothetical protein
MARKPRFNLPGFAQHIVQCGNNPPPFPDHKDETEHLPAPRVRPDKRGRPRALAS